MASSDIEFGTLEVGRVISLSSLSKIFQFVAVEQRWKLTFLLHPYNYHLAGRQFGQLNNLVDVVCCGNELKF